VQVTILNLLGEPVRVLMNGELPAGGYRMPWDGRDETGHRLPSGTYWYRLQSEDRVLTKKLLLLK
jgi:flagellar hook assembly protein FlgD